MVGFEKIPNVLVTGGAGSFGRAFCRYLLQHNLAERVCVYSRGEHAQALMRAQLEDDSRLRFFVGDVRDATRLVRAMQGVDLVVHAAALKRVEVGRYNPEEMVKTNILGALNVIEAARLAGVRKVVALSTDKAFEPVSAYGTSKMMMEQLMLAANETSGEAGPVFCVTRYGNVWGSAGSVLPRWIDLIRCGWKSVPVTDPECTRFFMLMPEAIALVMGAAVHGKRGTIAVPTLPAYRIGDLAEALDTRMTITGLPAHEKRHESMAAGNSSDKARRMSAAELRQHVHQWLGEQG
jgi:UDP-N-acetylglucosamine 4,6-dehydratase/5-epimerase